MQLGVCPAVCEPFTHLPRVHEGRGDPLTHPHDLAMECSWWEAGLAEPCPAPYELLTGSVSLRLLCCVY